MKWVCPLSKRASRAEKNGVTVQNDINGLPQELTKYNGEVVWSAVYDALGRVDRILVDEVAQPLRMQGQYWDEEIALCYNRHRYFDPQICAFISQDPIGLAGGDNVYAYAPNVWGWVDPLGLKCEQALPKFTDYQAFNSVFRFKPRKYGREMWNEYLHSPEKFAGRQRVQDTLKAQGFWRYTPAERVENAYRDVSHAYLLSHGDSDTAKAVQFFANLAAAQKDGMPEIYDTLSGKLGTIAGTIISKLLPF